MKLPLGQFPHNKPIPWVVAYEGKEYRGEILLTSSWRGEWGQLSAHIPFRIVLLDRFQSIPPETITNPGLCLCLPQRAKTIRERGEIKPQAYAQGEILTLPPLSLNPAKIFSIADDRRRFDYLAYILLVYREVWDRFPYHKVEEIAPLLPEIAKVRAYLEGIELPEGELNLDRVSILEQLALDNLMGNIHLWESIKALFSWFKGRYRNLYSTFHHQYYAQTSAIRARLEEAMPKVRALNLLNSIPELGEPLGVGLAEEYQRLLNRIVPCPLGEGGQIPLEESPLCLACGLGLLSQPPQRQADDLLKKLERALREQHRRLSTEAIHLILSRRGEARVDQFIKVIQTSDPSPLVNVLDEGLVDFLRHLLQEAQVYTLHPPIWEQLREKFPFVEEKDIKEVVAEFDRIIKESLAQAKREMPGRRIRLVLTPEDETRGGSGQPR